MTRDCAVSSGSRERTGSPPSMSQWLVMLAAKVGAAVNDPFGKPSYVGLVEVLRCRQPPLTIDDVVHDHWNLPSVDH